MATTSWRDRWHALPAAVRWTIGLLAALVMYGTVQWWLDRDGPFLQRWGIVLIFIATCFAGGAVQNRRRLGGRDQPRLLRRSLREGRVVEGAARDRWAVEIPRRARFLREHTVFYRVAGGLSLVLLVAVSAFAVMSGGRGVIVVTVVIVLPLALLIIAMMIWLLPWQRDRFARLASQLDRD